MEAIATVLLSVATVATAWCAYQSTVFGGVEEFELHEAEATKGEVYAMRALTTQLKMLDVSLFTNWANANATGTKVLADFYESRFPPRLKKAFDAWSATDPLNNPTAPKHPFIMPEYKVAEEMRADSLQSVYASKVQAARNINSHSEHYVLLTVIFASVLFFGGIASNITSLPTKVAIVIGSAIILLASLVWMFTFPMIVR